MTTDGFLESDRDRDRTRQIVMGPHQAAVPASVDESLSSTACQRCRKQKLRCSRQYPTCTRCSRVSITCTYPRPADRKLLAARRGATRAEQNPPTPVGPRTQPQSAVDSVPTTSILIPLSDNLPIDTHVESRNAGGHDLDDGVPALANHVSLPIPVSPGLQDLPPRAIGLGLLDIYFERLYNADLIFHRSHVFQNYLDGTIPSFLLRAIFALASLFLRQPPYLPTRLCCSAPAELVALAGYAKNGLAWAESASREALLLADRPSIVAIQAFSCLGMYWFSIGDMDRARIHIVIAYTSCSNFRPLAFSADIEGDGNNILHKEREQCCFWACWASICASAIPDAYARNAWEEACDVPLPLAPGQLRVTGCLSRLDYMDRNWNCLPILQTSNPQRVANPTSIMGEYMKLIGVWARIQILSRTSQEEPDIVWIERLSAIAKQIYESSQFPPWSTGKDTISKDHARILGLHSLYHLCQMVVLCPLVSLFSGRQAKPGDSREQTRANAEIMTKHAIMHGQLIRDYIVGRGDISKLSPLVGFAGFVATSIFLTLLRSGARRHQDRQEGLVQTSHQLLVMIQDTIDILSILQTFWEPLRPMAKKLQDTTEHVLRSGDLGLISYISERPQVIQVPLLGVNSPVQGEDVITTTYIESPQYRGPHQSTSSGVNCHSGEEDRRYQGLHQRAGEHVGRQYQDAFDWCRTGELPDLSGELLDFGNTADWNLDFLAEFPIQMA